MYALVDCNNFYASCERVFNPSLNNKPVIILSNNDGCVIARSNEAKAIGIQMGVPAFKIKNIIKKHNVKFFSTNFALYGDMSQRVMNILSNLIPNIEIYSIDEAFLDMREFKHKDVESICCMIREKLLQYTGIPVSIGVGRTKTLAKAANHIAKKYIEHRGVFVLHSNCENSILDKIPIEKIWGVGKKLYNLLRLYGIKTAKQLRDVDLIWAKSKMTVVGEKMVKELRGESCHLVEYSSVDKKSICTSRTFGNMVDNLNDLSFSIAMYTTRCAEKLRLQKSYAHVAQVFIMTNPFRKNLEQHVKSKTIYFPVATNDTSEMIKLVLDALKNIYKSGYQYKKAGVVLSGIIKKGEVQENLFDKRNRFKNETVIKTIDKINRKMGQDVVRYAALGYKRVWQLKQQNLSPCYTTRWNDLLKINLD